MIVGGPDGLATSDERIRGFQQGLSDAGRPAAEVMHVPFNRNGGFGAGVVIARKIKEAAGQPRLCIFASNDVMAIGVAAALREQG